MVWLILGGAAIWLLLSLVVALALGRMAKLADTAEADARIARELKMHIVDFRTADLEQREPAPMRRAG